MLWSEKEDKHRALLRPERHPAWSTVQLLLLLSLESSPAQTGGEEEGEEREEREHDDVWPQLCSWQLLTLFTLTGLRPSLSLLLTAGRSLCPASSLPGQSGLQSGVGTETTRAEPPSTRQAWGENINKIVLDISGPQTTENNFIKLLINHQSASHNSH